MPQYQSPGVYVEEVPPAVRPIAGVGTSTAGFIGIVPQAIQLPADRLMKENVPHLKVQDVNLPASGEVYLFTNWSQFVQKFADLVGDKSITGLPEVEQAVYDVETLKKWRRLAHAVYGFFNNGGTRCYVVRIDNETGVVGALTQFERIDEIAIVAIPGITTEAEQESVIDHCENLKDRFAILDGQQVDVPFAKPRIQGETKDSSFSAIYFPWLKVFDPAQKVMEPEGNGSIFVPPSGHVAGVYARVDGERGVHKAPGNEVIRGALDVEHRLTKAEQDGLNPDGVNIIRAFNGNIKIWGARTMGGDANAEFKYISTRRFFNFLRESIDEGMQWVVFEPNSPALWQRITRNVSDFLLGQWRAGALFGETPKQAFFVKCDAETNPPDVRELGQVVTNIGVAIVKPAEFVIFRIEQVTGS